MKKVYSMAIMIAAITMFSGCAKDGATGPQGPAGANGVANIGSSTFTANPGTWGNPSSGVYDFSVSDADITDGNSDLVEVFVQTSSGGNWFAMPVSNLLTFSNDVMGFSYNTGTVTVYYLYSSAPTISLGYKFVVIPPAMKKPNVDYSNYAAVKSAYNLKD